jgi:hypothetical protein
MVEDKELKNICAPKTDQQQEFGELYFLNFYGKKIRCFWKIQYRKIR